MSKVVHKIALLLVLISIIVMEIKAFSVTIASLGTGILIYYTEISNLITLISAIIALVLVLIGLKKKELEFPVWLSSLRFLSSTMLLMTMLVTIFVLVPYSPHLKDELLFSNYGLYHHTLVPIISVLSFVLLEPHYNKKRILFVPLIATFIYGIVMILLNLIGKVSGPYFFLKVHNQALTTTVLWMVGLLVLVSFFAFLIWICGALFDKLKEKILKIK